MHKSHGEVVTQVLQQQIVEHAAKLVEGAIDDTSMLGLVIGKTHLEYQSQLAAEPGEHGPARGAMISPSSVQPQNAALAQVEELLQSILARFGSVPAPESIKKGKTRRKLGKRDTVIFAAILMGLKGIRYCSFLQDHGLRPRWPDSDPATTYPKSYMNGDPWRKKVQDEKTRAKLRMNGYDLSELATALNTYLPKEFDEISRFLYSCNSPDASKTSTP